MLPTGVSLLVLLASLAKSLAASFFIFLIFHFNLSFFWLVLPVTSTVIQKSWRKQRNIQRKIVKDSASYNERDAIQARVSDLPSWVHFPDVERAEWLNKIMNQIWPNVNGYIKSFFKDIIEPAVGRTMTAYRISEFQFQNMILGSIPPRIGGIKVYDKHIPRKEIMMDIDLFYAGDCDISFRIAGIVVGIKDFQLHGLIRIVLKPLISDIPLIGGLQISFMNNPEVDYKLFGLAEVLEWPGISDLLRRNINEQIANKLVHPNKLTIQLHDYIKPSDLKATQPQGVFRVHLIEAQNLMKMDGIFGKSDPYALIKVRDKEFRSPTIDRTLNPSWDFHCEFMLDQPYGEMMSIRLFDYDKASSDDNMGRASIFIGNVVKSGEVDTWITLKEAKHGKVHLNMTWLSLSDNIEDLKVSIFEVKHLPGLSSALLTVFIDSVKNLPVPKSSQKPDPYVTVVLGNHTEVSPEQSNTVNPVFEIGFTFFVHNPEMEVLSIKICDKKTGKEIGELKYNLRKLMVSPNMSLDSRPFLLKGSGCEAELVASMSLRALKRSVTEQPSDDLDNIDETANNVTTPVPSKKRIRRQRTIENIDHAALVKQSSLSGSMRNSSKVQNNVQKKLPEKGSSVQSDNGLGRIELSFKYKEIRQTLEVTVHQICDIPSLDLNNMPYVKMYLLPERKRSSKRRATSLRRNNQRPIYEKTFRYITSSSELCQQHLEISVCTKVGHLRPEINNMGKVLVHLDQLDLLQMPERKCSAWFYLRPWDSK